MGIRFGCVATIRIILGLALPFEYTYEKSGEFMVKHDDQTMLINMNFWRIRYDL